MVVSSRRVEDRMRADWRALPRQSEIIASLTGLLTQLDAQGTLLKEVSESQGRGAYDGLLVPSEIPFGDPQRMVVRWNNPITKTVWHHAVRTFR